MADDVSTAGTEDLSLRWVTVPAFLYVLAHYLAFLLPERFWGVDCLVYAPAHLTVLFAIISGAVLFGPVRGQLITLLLRVRTSVSTPLLAFFLCLTVVFVGLVTHTETHLLGDGLRYIRYLRESYWDSNPRADRAPLTFWLVRQIHGWIDDPDRARMAYAYVSLGSGVLYVILSVVAGRTFAEAGRGWVITGLLLVQGYMVMFFGYVETYPILFPALLGVLILAKGAMDRHTPVWIPAMALGVTTTLHVLTVAALTALVWAGIRRSTSNSSCLVSMLVLLATPVTTALTLMAIGLPADWFLKAQPGSFRLPWFDSGSLHIPYAVFSVAHLVELVNQYALAAPAFLICSLVGLRSKRTDVDGLLWSAALPLVGFTVLFHPEIGAFRDWDAFSLPALPLTLLAGRWMTRIHDSGSRLQVGIVVVVVCGSHTAAWAQLNSDSLLSESRFSHLVERSHMSPPARAHGAGSLAAHFRESGRLDDAQKAFKDAIRHHGGNPRYHVGLAHILYLQGDLISAEASLKRAVEAGPDRLDTLINLGLLFLDMRRFDEASATFLDVLSLNGASTPAIHGLGLVRYRGGRYPDAIVQFKRASELAPNNATYLHDLGTAYLASGDLAQAELTLRRVVQLAPDRVDARANLGNVYFQRGDYDAAAAAFRSALLTAPGRANIHLNLGLVYRELKDNSRAREHLLRFLELAPSDTEAGRVTSLLGELN